MLLRPGERSSGPASNPPAQWSPTLFHTHSSQLIYSEMVESQKHAVVLWYISLFPLQELPLTLTHTLGGRSDTLVLMGQMFHVPLFSFQRYLITRRFVSYCSLWPCLRALRLWISHLRILPYVMSGLCKIIGSVTR